MALPPWQEQQFDESAEKARAEFEQGWQQWTARDVAIWWDKWCRNGQTNHDRLGKVLMDVTGVRRHRTSHVIGRRALTEEEERRFGR